MPRIDPIQLLKCLSVLLSSKGGILSNDEVHRLASLMTKFSKKLVSKCIYIQILKCTETELLGSFMGSGGWRLAHMWLTESIVAKNWPLVRELLELLLLCPVDIDLLKTNNCPKLVKELSKDGSQAAIRALAAKLVEQWLKTVKGELVSPISEEDFAQIIAEGANQSELDKIKKEEIAEVKEEAIKKEIKSEKDYSDIDMAPLNIKEEIGEREKESETLPILKISLKDGKQVISKIDDNVEIKNENLTTEKEKDNKSSKSKSKSHDTKTYKSKHSNSSKRSSRSHSSKSSSSDKIKKDSSSNSGSSSSSKDKHSHKKHSSSDKYKDKRTIDKNLSSYELKEDKIKSETSHRSDKKKDEKHKRKTSKDEIEINTKEKPESALCSPVPKLMKIPKLSDSKRETPSISIETRNPNDPNRPKTVKTFHSKFRSHGLEEEAKPPPPRGLVKKSAPVLPPILPIPKRLSPPHNLEQPPEKKSKSIEIEKPGSIKLIPAKPKPSLLLESDMFMDALNASATNKKEPKKRKRRTSGSKDGNPNSDASPPTTPTTIPQSASVVQENKASPLRFYKDTLETEEEKDPSSENTSDNSSKLELPADLEKKDDENDSEPHVRIASNGLRGVLCYHKKKGPKKSIKWKADSELEQIQYFELDETERVNVSKTFLDMKNLERVHEREAVQKARNLLNEDVMAAKTTWRPLIPVDVGCAITVEYGKNSKEQDIQAARQKSVLQSLYLKTMIPDYPSEPDFETHTNTEPTIIPLDDITGNPDTVSDFRNTPWPDPKGTSSSNTISSTISVPQNIFPPMAQFPGPYPNPQFNMPGFQPAGPTLMPPGGEWQNTMPNANMMIPGNMPPGPMLPGPGPIPPVLMNPGNMPPGMMIPPPDGMMGPDMFGGPGFPLPPEAFNMNGPPNMFPPGFPINMPGGPCPPGPENVNFSFNNRGGMRGRGSSNQWRGNWDGPNRGRGGHAQGGWKKAKCIHFMKKGSCRQGDSCGFLHPGVNCPY